MGQTKASTFKGLLTADRLIVTPGQYAVFVAFLNQGDEVIMFEPFFDQYMPSITLNGGVPVFVPLHPQTDGKERPTGKDWVLDFDELRYVFALHKLIAVSLNIEQTSYHAPH